MPAQSLRAITRPNSDNVLGSEPVTGRSVNPPSSPTRARRYFDLRCDDRGALVNALSRGLTLGRTLTPGERLSLAVALTLPTHLLTIDSTYATPTELHAAWRRLVKRVNRQNGNRDWIYFATVSRSSCGGGGYHVHALLWNFIYLPRLLGHTRKVGLGKPQIEQLDTATRRICRMLDPPCTARHLRLVDAVKAAAYVIGQHEPVFGSTQHLRHVCRLRWNRRYIYPQRRTLERNLPELLAALERARDPTAADDRMLFPGPKFSM